MIWFYFCKEKKKSCPKNGNFQRFQQFFFRTTRFELKLLTLIKSSNIFHWKPAKKKKMKVDLVLGQTFGEIRSIFVKKVKKQALSTDFFHILHGEYLLKEKVGVKHLSGNLRQLQLEMSQLNDIRAKFLSNLSQKW